MQFPSRRFGGGLVDTLTNKGPESHGAGFALDNFPEHANRIARIIGLWSVIELSLITCLAMMAKTEQAIILPMLYAIQSSRGRLGVISAAVLRILPEGTPLHAQFNGVLEKAGAVLTMRDKYAHAIYGMQQVEGTYAKLTIFSVTNPKKSHDLPLHDLNHQLKRAEDLFFEVSNIMTAVQGGLVQQGP